MSNKGSNKDLNNFSDEDLMVSYQDGNFQAFEIIYKRYSPLLYAYLLRKSNPTLAQDLTQEVFAKLHSSRMSYNQKFPLRAWIFTITRNHLFDFLRSSQNKLDSLTDHNEDLIQKTSLTTEESEEIDLTMALKQLTENQRIAIELRYHKDWSFEQIATELDTSEMNVRKLISRALQKVRESFSKKEVLND